MKAIRHLKCDDCKWFGTNRTKSICLYLLPKNETFVEENISILDSPISLFNSIMLKKQGKTTTNKKLKQIKMQRKHKWTDEKASKQASSNTHTIYVRRERIMFWEPTEENELLRSMDDKRKRFSSFSHFNELIYLWIQATALQFYL